MSNVNHDNGGYVRFSRAKCGPKLVGAKLDFALSFRRLLELL